LCNKQLRNNMTAYNSTALELCEFALCPGRIVCCEEVQEVVAVVPLRVNAVRWLFTYVISVNKQRRGDIVWSRADT